MESMMIRRCGNFWVCCDGKCENCKATDTYYSTRTEEVTE